LRATQYLLADKTRSCNPVNNIFNLLIYFVQLWRITDVADVFAPATGTYLMNDIQFSKI